MMASSCYQLAVFLFWLCLVGVRSSEVQIERNDLECQLVCLIDVVGFLYNNGDEESSESQGDKLYSCQLQDDAYRSRAGYRIKLPLSFSQTYKEELAGATATICISEGSVDRSSHMINIADNAELSLLPSRRKLQTASLTRGRRTILAVQLTTNFISDVSGRTVDEDPGMSKDEIAGSIFGTGPNAPGHDLVSQYRACSFGALDFEPATGTNIVNGVAEVRMRNPVAGGEILGSLQDDILEATEERVGSLDQFDHVIYCMPDDALMDGADKWTAFTYFHSHWSFFQRRRCSAMSVTIHELGHNLGFRHSGYDDESYGAEEGYMGFTVYEVGAPLKCFNAHKNWISGWFQDRTIRVDPAIESARLLRLVTYVDYDKTMHPYDVVIIRVGSYYIQYNRAKGINIGTGMHADTVTVTYAKDEESESEAIAGLSPGQAVKLPNYRNTGFALSIEVCEFGTTGGGSDSSSASVLAMERQAIFGDGEETVSSVDYAWVSIYLENGVQQSKCDRIGQETAEPSASLTTSSPTLQPTSLPTQKPSDLSAHPSSIPAPTSQSPASDPPTVVSKQAADYSFDTGIALPQQEKLLKRINPPATIKEMNKLVKENDKPERKLRLKGGR